jgi:hypothetical protein
MWKPTVLAAVLALTLLAAHAAPLRAQPPAGQAPPATTPAVARYVPERGKPPAREVVAVVVASSRCEFSTRPRFMQAVDPLLRALQGQARARGSGFAAVGVAVDVQADSGFAYFRRLAEFDEVVAGRTWLNSGLLYYATPARVTTQMTPSLIVFEREIVDGARHTTVGPERHLVSVLGLDSVVAFANRGAPLPQ